MYEIEIEQYEAVRSAYQQKVAGRTGRLLANFILLRAGHPLLIVDLKDRGGIYPH